MANHTDARACSLRVEQLETRLTPATSLTESFDGAQAGRLPAGWSQWDNSPDAAFAVSNRRAQTGSLGLLSTGGSDVVGRAWHTSQQPADVEVSASAYLDGLSPAQVLARGRGLDTTKPTYYAASVSRGLKVQLLRVVGGAVTVLGTVTSDEYFSAKWVRVTVSAQGDRLKARVYRADTGQYLTASGAWSSSPAWALERTDRGIGGGGQAGVARSQGYAGNLAFDDFAVAAPNAAPTASDANVDTFDNTPSGKLPAGWSQWSSDNPSFAASSWKTVSGNRGLLSTGGSDVTARAWQTSSRPADVEVSASAYLDGLSPAQVLARGRGLDTAKPTYYAASVTRGLSVQLLRVVGGVTTVLGEVRSDAYFSAKWARVTVSAQGDRLKVRVYRADTGRYLTASGAWSSSPAWAIERTDRGIGGSGQAGLARARGYAGNLAFDDFAVTTLSGGTTAPPPGGTTTPPGGTTIPRHYNHIRIAQLAYSGTPLGALEDQLLRESVDLVVTDVPRLSEHINKVAPSTPQMAYINFTSLYQELLTAWLTYADAEKLPRESAFYHVRKATSFSGDSPSSQPVDWFWRVYVGGGTPGFRELTAQAHLSGRDVAFGGVGEATYLGYPDKFREINVSLAQGAGSGWSAVLEYATAADAYGNPTAWATLKTVKNSTNGLKNSGQILFDPPRDWKPAALNGTEPLYYVRLRTVAPGRAPVANTILARDYVNARGKTSGVIPAFDAAADKDGDGYLNDAEYARRAKGKDARFLYESRLFFGNYGQMRFATNPSSPIYRAWAAEHAKLYLEVRPRADGLFVDNSIGDPLVAAGAVNESVSAYARDYGKLLAEVGKAVAPRWVLANTSGAGSRADEIVRLKTSYYEEYLIRPLAHDWGAFEDVAAMVAHRASLSPSSYAILDSLPTGGSPTDSRTQLATLAYYYLVADPERTFLNFFGGYEPGTTWARHWTPAAAYDVGRPQGTWSMFASGADPADLRYGYRVYGRNYSNALVLYKPLSTNPNGFVNGTLADRTATTHQLNGTYRQLRADGTLGPRVTSVRLRNGEGAILIKA